MIQKNNNKSTPPLWLKLLNPVKKNVGPLKEYSPIFILSTGRTGTTYLADYFNLYPDTFATHEPKPSRKLRLLSMARLQNAVDDQYLESVLKTNRYSLITSNKEKFYVESNPFLVGFAKAISMTFDNPTILHVVRDPRDYIRSGINHGATVGLKNVLNQHLKYWTIDVAKDPTDSKHTHMIKRLATFWVLSNNFLLEAKETCPNYHFIKFEDLFDDSYDLRDLARTIGLPKAPAHDNKKDDSSINKSQRKVLQSWQEWSKEDCVNVNKICQPLMEQFGYGLEKEWKNRIKT